jgi:hypothetical protein
MATPQPGRGPALVPTNGIAIAGMVCGIGGLVLFFLPLVGFLLAVVGVVLGAIGMGRAKRMAGKHHGFAIAGLVCGLVGSVMGLGILAAVAIPAFLEYNTKPRKIESQMQLERMKEHFELRGMLPPSSQGELPGPAGSGCGTRDGKIAALPASEWLADPAWREINFIVNGPSYFSYRWTRESETRGYAEASADLACDGIVSVTRMDVELVDGVVTTRVREPTPPD